jgi:hypothetical protein
MVARRGSPARERQRIGAAHYLGDYDGMASGSTNSNPGFIGAFQFLNSGGNSNNDSNSNPQDHGDAARVPNPDVFAVKLN